MDRWRRWCSLAIVALLVSAVPCSSAKLVDGIVAVVNNDIILTSELERQWRLVTRSNPKLASATPEELKQIKMQLLRKMIRERLAEQEIKRLKIIVSDSEVDRAIERIKKENGLSDAQLKMVLSQDGQTFDQFRDQIRKDIERSRLLERVFKAKTVISDEQIDQYLAQNQDTVKERRHLAVIVFPFHEGMSEKDMAKLKEAADKVYRRLQKGESFAKLARRYSRGPTAKDGGDIGYISTDDLAPALEKATRGLGPGETTPVIQTDGGYYILKLLDVRRQGVDKVDSNARERVRRLLMRKEINRKFEAWIKDLENRSYIHVNPDNILVETNEPGSQ